MAESPVVETDTLRCVLFSKQPRSPDRITLRTKHNNFTLKFGGETGSRTLALLTPLRCSKPVTSQPGQHLSNNFQNGKGDRTRTCNLRSQSPAVCQLSYTPIKNILSFNWWVAPESNRAALMAVDLHSTSAPCLSLPIGTRPRIRTGNSQFLKLKPLPIGPGGCF